MDQDAFNYVLCSKRIPLPYRYNFRTPLFDVKSFDEINRKFFGGKYRTVDECIEGQAVLHMSDRMKPWRYNIPWFTKLFTGYYRISPYGDAELSLESPLKPLRDEIRSLQKSYAALLAYTREHKVWRFPKEKVPGGCRLILYGAGEVGRDYYGQIRDSGHCKVVLWVDKKYRELQNISMPELILKVKFDFILIAIEKKAYVKEVKKELEDMGINLQFIIEGF